MLRAGQRLGKYKIRRRIASGGFAAVFEAYDTIEGVPVALKIPLAKNVGPEVLADFRKEARLAATLEHPNVLPLKNADIIGETFVIAYPLGQGSLADRLSRRLSHRRLLDYAEQLLCALAHAHAHSVIHCDVKPDNLIVFDDDNVRLADFGIAKVAQRTIDASASGTVGYMAPEQALGRPSARSDVFSAGLLIHRLFTGHVPQWPFEWPGAGYERLHKAVPELEPVLRRALLVDTRKRYRDAGQMLEAFRPAKKKILRRLARNKPGSTRPSGKPRDWKTIRIRQFRRRFGKGLRLTQSCGTCDNPVDERMSSCPWCGAQPLELEGNTGFPARCPRCTRGIKLDWVYCAWCRGPKIGPQSNRSFTDRRYTVKCSQPACRKPLMPFMRNCPWCRTRVDKRWRLGSGTRPCSKCRQPVAPEFWSWCPWCGTSVEGS